MANQKKQKEDVNTRVMMARTIRAGEARLGTAFVFRKFSGGVIWKLCFTEGDITVFALEHSGVISYLYQEDGKDILARFTVDDKNIYSLGVTEVNINDPLLKSVYDYIYAFQITCSLLPEPELLS